MNQALEIKSVSKAPAHVVLRPLSLRSNVVWTGIGLAVYYGSQYLVLPLIAKLTDAATVGQYAMGLAITAPIIVFSQMQFRQLQVTDVSGEYSFGDYFWTRIYCTFAAILVILGLICFSSYSPAMRLTVVLIAITKALESLSDLAYGNIQKYDRMDKVAVAMCCRGIFSTLAFGALLVITHKLAPAVAGVGTVWAAILIGYELPNARRISGRAERITAPSSGIVQRLLRMGMVIAVTSTLVSFSGNLSCYYLDRYCGHASVGLFTAASTSLGVMALVAGALSQGTLARASVYYASRDTRSLFGLFFKVSSLLLGVSLAFVVVLVLIGKPIVSILFRPSYGSIVLPMIIMAAGVSVNMLGAFAVSILMIARRFNLFLACTIAMLLTQVVASRLLIPQYGVIGAAWTEAIRYCVAMLALNAVALFVFRRHLAAAPSAGEKE